MATAESTVRHIADQMLATRGWSPLGGAEPSACDTERPAVLSGITVYTHADKRLALMFAHAHARIGIRDVRTLIEYARTCDVAHIVLVTTAAVTAFAQQNLGQLAHSNGLRVETWLRSHLLINPLMHRLCPPMRVLSAEERSAVAARHRLRDLPKILEDDIVARFCGARAGDVFEIVRPHPDGYTYTVHRTVV